MDYEHRFALQHIIRISRKERALQAPETHKNPSPRLVSMPACLKSRRWTNREVQETNVSRFCLLHRLRLREDAVRGVCLVHGQVRLRWANGQQRSPIFLIPVGVISNNPGQKSVRKAFGLVCSLHSPLAAMRRNRYAQKLSLQKPPSEQKPEPSLSWPRLK